VAAAHQTPPHLNIRNTGVKNAKKKSEIKSPIPRLTLLASEPLPNMHHAQCTVYLLQMKLGMFALKKQERISKGAHSDRHGWAHGCLLPQLKVEAFQQQLCIMGQPWVTKIFCIAHVSLNELSWEWVAANKGLNALLQTTGNPLASHLLRACRDSQRQVLPVACNAGTADNTTFL
jgi:hypothetical protein